MKPSKTSRINYHFFPDHFGSAKNGEDVQFFELDGGAGGGGGLVVSHLKKCQHKFEYLRSHRHRDVLYVPTDLSA